LAAALDRWNNPAENQGGAESVLPTDRRVFKAYLMKEIWNRFAAAYHPDYRIN
jgi:hypothetical protein